MLKAWILGVVLCALCHQPKFLQNLSPPKQSADAEVNHKRKNAWTDSQNASSSIFDVLLLGPKKLCDFGPLSPSLLPCSTELQWSSAGMLQAWILGGYPGVGNVSSPEAPPNLAPPEQSASAAQWSKILQSLMFCYLLPRDRNTLNHLTHIAALLTRAAMPQAWIRWELSSCVQCIINWNPSKTLHLQSNPPLPHSDKKKTLENSNLSCFTIQSQEMASSWTT